MLLLQLPIDTREASVGCWQTAAETTLVNGMWPWPHSHPPNHPQEHLMGGIQLALRTLTF